MQIYTMNRSNSNLCFKRKVSHGRRDAKLNYVSDFAMQESTSLKLKLSRNR
jgi:hypothetical protein